MNWLRRLAAYERPWVGRVGMALGALLWLLVTVAAFAGSVGLGVAVLILGVAYILGEVWSARHPSFAAGWRGFVQIGAGVYVIVFGVRDADGWTIVLPVLFGGWLVFWGLAVAIFLWREGRETAADGDA